MSSKTKNLIKIEGRRLIKEEQASYSTTTTRLTSLVTKKLESPTSCFPECRMQSQSGGHTVARVDVGPTGL